MPASDNLPATYSPCHVFYNVCNTKLYKGPACLQDNYLDAIYRQNICLSERGRYHNNLRIYSSSYSAQNNH